MGEVQDTIWGSRDQAQGLMHVGHVVSLHHTTRTAGWINSYPPPRWGWKGTQEGLPVTNEKSGQTPEPQQAWGARADGSFQMGVGWGRETGGGHSRPPVGKLGLCSQKLSSMERLMGGLAQRPRWSTQGRSQVIGGAPWSPGPPEGPAERLAHPPKPGLGAVPPWRGRWGAGGWSQARWTLPG